MNHAKPKGKLMVGPLFNFILIVFLLPILTITCSQNQISSNGTSSSQSDDYKTFHLSYFNHCSKLQTHDENLKQVNISHPGLKNLLIEDGCRVSRLHQYFQEKINLCDKTQHISQIECYHIKIKEMMESAPLNEQVHLMVLGIGLNLLNEAKDLKKDAFLYTATVADFTLLILESLAVHPAYGDLFSDLKVKSLEDIPLNQWKNFHPQLSRESSFTKDDEFPIFLLYSRLFADNFAYEMIEKVRGTLFYLETLSISKSKDKQDKIFNLMQRFHKVRELYLDRFIEICNADISSGCNQVGGSYLRTRNEAAKALPYLTKSCSLLDGSGCGILGDYYLTNGDTNSSLRHYTLGCLYNNSTSCDLAGTLHYKKDEKQKAISFFQTACENQDDLGCLYLKGIKRKPKGRPASKISELKGTWKGTYKCPQGETNVTLTINDEKKISFQFNKDDKFVGEFDGKIRIDNKTLYFNPKTKNITKKLKGNLENWYPVGFSGEIFPETIVGKMNDPACDTIYLEKF